MTEPTLTDVSKKNTSTNGKMPLLPLRDVVVYPHLVIPLFVGRDKSVKALEIKSSKIEVAETKRQQQQQQRQQHH